MSRSVLAALVVVLAVTPTVAQSKVESFTTTYDPLLDAHTHETAYEFAVPDLVDIDSGRIPTEVLLDVYYNTRRVMLLDTSIECLDNSGDWRLFANTTSHSHFASLRTAVYSETCRVRLGFVNNQAEQYANSPQKAAVRINVSATTSSLLALTKLDVIVPTTVSAKLSTPIE